jgi:hypothetical protein
VESKEWNQCFHFIFPPSWVSFCKYLIIKDLKSENRTSLKWKIFHSFHLEWKAMKKMTAAEIAALKLDGLPTSKVGVRALADREGWPYEEVKGVGGTRRMYSVPEKYLAVEGTSLAAPIAAKVIGAIAAGSSKVDPVKLELAIRALSEWEVERQVKVAEDRRPAVIAILYDYLQNADVDGGEEAMAVVLRALG